MSAYDYDAPPRRERTSKHHREERVDSTRYADPRDPYLSATATRDVAIRPIHRDSDLSVEEIHRDFPPPGYARGGDIRRARSAEPYDYDDDARSYVSRRSRGDDYYDDRDYAPRPRRKAESVYIEEEERKQRRVLGQQEKIIAAIAGAAVAIGGKEFYDRQEAKKEGYRDPERNPISSAALGAAGALAAYQSAEFYNKRADKSEKKSTHIVHKGRDGRVTEYYSDDEDEKEKKGHKNFLESALAAAGLSGAVKALTGGGGGGGGSDEKHRDRDRDYRDDTRSRRGSRSRSRSRSPAKAGGSKVQKAAMASLIAGATEAFRVSKEPGSWKGEKAKRVLTAAAGAATIDAAQKSGKDGSKLGLAESVIGGLIGNRMINGSKRDIIEDKETGRSRSRSRARSASRGGGGGGGVSGLAALATAGLGAIGAKKVIENHRERSRSRRRDDSVDSYDSRDASPKRSTKDRARSRSRSVVDTARRSLARIGIGKGERDVDDDYESTRGSSRRDRDLVDDRGGRGYRDDYDDDVRSSRARSRSRGGGRAAASRASSRGSVSSSELGDSDEDEKRAKKMRGKQIITTGLAAVATIHAAHNVYQSVEKRNARHKAVKQGKLSPEEARKLKSKALLQDAASVGIAALGIKGAISEMKEAREMHHELSEWQEEKDKRHQKRLERQGRSRSTPGGGRGGGGDDYYGSRSRADNSISPGPPRASRYDDGPRYSDGNPYATALPAPPVGYDSRR